MTQSSHPEQKTIYDNISQLKRIEAYVIPGETLVAVFDCKGTGTGFVGFTDQRLIFYDQAFMTNEKAMVSIPYNQVVAVAWSDEGMILTTGRITLLTAAGKFTFTFRGADKANMAYRYIMKQILNQAHPQLPG